MNVAVTGKFLGFETTGDGKLAVVFEAPLSSVPKAMKLLYWSLQPAGKRVFRLRILRDGDLQANIEVLLRTFCARNGKDENIRIRFIPARLSELFGPLQGLIGETLRLEAEDYVADEYQGDRSWNPAGYHGE